ncbi:MAG: type I DNA topoisomerase [Bacteroidetes bacterium]|nr:type I DNA topoisomerase [Bacteroidota bacterium]
MAGNLVIVESPAKAKTISNFLGKEYLVKSCFGHVRDLHEKELSVDVKNNFKPKYYVDDDKKKIVDELRRLSRKAKLVWLATDEDREGEAISWHLKEALELEDEKIRRIVFHEITKTAIIEATENPRSIDRKLVDAQQARRVLDRLVGYELSPLLWKKVKPALSAGRVQSVTVRLLVEKEREINGFTVSSFFKVIGHFIHSENGKTVIFSGEINRRFSSEQEATAFLTALSDAEFTVSSVEKKPVRKTPPPPFITSTLQQEASRKFGYSVSQTMRLAQALYEAGRITYMRTDSVTLSGFALNAAKNEITRLFGSDYLHKRQFETKSHLAQEAHEAIRPTYMNNRNVETEDEREAKLYDLIWKRTIASQMKDAEIEKTVVTISANRVSENFIATGEVVAFDGFLKVYMESEDDEQDEKEKDEAILPPLNTGMKLTLDKAVGTQRYTQPPARYTEASLVKKLETLGIGRPSTYAPIISTIQKRGYVVKEIRQGQKREFIILTLLNQVINREIKSENTGFEKNKLYPTDIGMVVSDFLEERFPQVMDYNFTAKVEEEFDSIALGDMKWTEMIREFYDPFHKRVEHVTEKAVKVTGERELGKDPASGKKIIVRIGRFGPIVQKGEPNGKEKPVYASLRNHQRMETITLEDALVLLDLPRKLGAFEEFEILANTGRFGPYLKHNGKFFSLPKTDDLSDISLERAIEIIREKRKRDIEKTIKEFPGESGIKVLRGKWGPYISSGKSHCKVPKDLNPEDLTIEDCTRFLNEAQQNKKGRYRKGKK